MRKILVAEDNETNQRVIRAILERRGCPYQIVNDGKEAIEAYNPELHALILMDCQMPNLDGLGAAEHIRATEAKSQWNRCPIIALTANAMNEDRAKCLGAGMDDFLSKPFKSQDLIAKLDQWLKGVA